MVSLTVLLQQMGSSISQRKK